jgi:outer membrane protein assembly factor BamB
VDPASGKVTFVAKSAEIASRQLALDGSMGGMTGGMISLSAGGGNNGVIWTLAPVDGNANQNVVAGALRAYDAVNLDTNRNADGSPRLKLLWDSTNWNINFNFSKFCPPVVADGKVFVATYDGRVDVYTLTP